MTAGFVRRFRHHKKYSLTAKLIIIIISFYSLVEHKARVKIRHLVLFAAIAFP
jgi:hypothetical protein